MQILSNRGKVLLGIAFLDMSAFMFHIKSPVQVTLKTRTLVSSWGELASSPKDGDPMINDAGKHEVNGLPPVFNFSKGFGPTLSARPDAIAARTFSGRAS